MTALLESPMKKPHGHRYEGLREGIVKLLKTHPSASYDLPGISRSFNGVPGNTISYHLGVLKNEGMIVSPKRGWYQWNREYKSDADKLAEVERHIANGESKLIVAKDENDKAQSFSLVDRAPMVMVLDVRYPRHVARSIENIKLRMRSGMPANEVFNELDEAVLDDLFGEWTSMTCNPEQREALKRDQKRA